MKEEVESSYKGIFKSTFLFGFVQVFNILAKIGINKAVAIFLGTEGMGVIGLYQSTINLLKTATGLGISQSAVRDVSEANGANDKKRFSKIITITNKIIWITAIFGAIVTLLLSSRLSQWTFGNNNYATPFMWISLVIFLNVLSEGQLAILKGMRRLRALAKASLLGSVVGLIAGVPLYYFYREKGIIPSLIITALTAVIFSWLYVRKINYEKQKVSAQDIIKEGTGMIQMGLSLMYVSFIVFASDYIIRTYISNVANLEMVGIFQAGATIISSYFGIVITAMSTDYYPRISAVNKDNKKLTEEVNRQSEVGLILMGPLIVLFMFAMPFFIKFLYSEKFLLSISYISYAVFGTIITICSNSMGMILLAKQKSKVFVISVTITRVIGITINLLSFTLWGLTGLGISAIIFAILHITMMQAIMYKLYNILFNKKVVFMLIFTLILSLVAFFIKDFSNNWLKYSIGLFILFVSLFYSITKMKKVMNIDIIDYIIFGIKKLIKLNK